MVKFDVYLTRRGLLGTEGYLHPLFTLPSGHIAGREGIAGPYKELGVMMQPDKESQIWEGWQGVATFNPFQLSNGQWLAFYGSAAGNHPKG